MNYLTDEQVATAKANGVSYKNLYNRFYVMGWDAERAITEPVGKEFVWTKHKEKCQKNGINSNTFYSRIYNGMTPEEAANTPLITPDKRRKVTKRKFTDEIIKKAAENGVGYATLVTRVTSHHWSIEKAINTPVQRGGNRKNYETISSC